MQEIVSGIKATYAEEHLRCGYADPLTTADNISKNFGIEDPHTIQALATIIRSYPTKHFLYNGIVEVLNELLDTGDSITIWTDDFLDRVLSSGIWKFRKDLPDDKKRRLKVISGLNKHEALTAKVIPSLREGTFGHVVFVDDKDKNLDEAKMLTTQHDLPMSPHFIRISWDGQSEDVMQKSETRVVFDVKSLLLEREDIVVHAGIDGGIKWLIDFNDALLDREAYTDARCELMGEIVLGKVTAFNEEIIRSIRL